MVSKRVAKDEIARRIVNVNCAFPDAMVENYESLIDGLVLPDERDRHVLAAAIKTNANIIVTNNLKDFPTDYLATFGLSAIGQVRSREPGRTDAGVETLRFQTIVLRLLAHSSLGGRQCLRRKF